MGRFENPQRQPQLKTYSSLDKTRKTKASSSVKRRIFLLVECEFWLWVEVQIELIIE